MESKSQYVHIRICNTTDVYVSVFPQIDTSIQVGDLFPWISMHHQCLPRRAGPRAPKWRHWRGPDRCKWVEQTVEEFVGGVGAALARQSGFAAAPANMSLNKGKSAAPGIAGCNVMQGSP